MRATYIILNLPVAAFEQKVTDGINLNNIFSLTEYKQILSFQQVASITLKVLNSHLWPVAAMLESMAWSVAWGKQDFPDADAC